MQKEGEKPSFERVKKVDTLLVGDAARSEIKAFRTALYPRQYHPCALENPLIKRVFAYKEFFRRTCRRKNKKCGLTPQKKIKLNVYRQTERRAKSPPFYMFVPD